MLNYLFFSCHIISVIHNCLLLGKMLLASLLVDSSMRLLIVSHYNVLNAELLVCCSQMLLICTVCVKHILPGMSASELQIVSRSQC